jgi:cytochrome c oxidase accessory protein FixG
MLSALTDNRTITVTYDARRGEPRGRLIRRDRQQGTAATGDCIDCHQCVTVCPTGIDIRDGIQLECVNCAACIDACNSVMHRLGRPAGLIRLTSHDTAMASANGPAGAASRFAWFNGRLTARAGAYGIVWLALVSSVAILLAGRRELDVLILRQPGTLYAAVTDADVANFYTVQAFNRTGGVTQFAIEVVEPRGATVTSLGRFDTVEPYGLLEGRLLLRVPRAALRGPKTPVRFAVRTNGAVVQIVESAFLGPAASPGAENQE